VFDVAAKSELPDGTINLQAAVKAKRLTKLFVANPWPLPFHTSTNTGYVARRPAILVKITSTMAESQRGEVPPMVTQPRSPSLMWARSARRGGQQRDTRAYVMNYISKDVS